MTMARHRYTVERFCMSDQGQRAVFAAAACGADTVAAVSMTGEFAGMEGGKFVTPDNQVHTLVEGFGYVFMREPVNDEPALEPDPFDGGCAADCR